MPLDRRRLGVLAPLDIQRQGCWQLVLLECFHGWWALSSTRLHGDVFVRIEVDTRVLVLEHAGSISIHLVLPLLAFERVLFPVPASSSTATSSVVPPSVAAAATVSTTTTTIAAVISTATPTSTATIPSVSASTIPSIISAATTSSTIPSVVSSSSSSITSFATRRRWCPNAWWWSVHTWRSTPIWWSPRGCTPSHRRPTSAAGSTSRPRPLLPALVRRHILVSSSTTTSSLLLLRLLLGSTVGNPFIVGPA
mmetsp:Transcript_13281/g.25307  ORF Transcript_13281/g.25307 Transcript_13281/m.25307 type:complete len:252 (-) Transcript_13281:204-959(-)